MRGKPFRGGSKSRLRVLCACAVALTGIWLDGVAATPAGAAACPNGAYRSGPSERLPDCRAYEQVSPVEKGGLDAATLRPVLAAQAAACEVGESCALAYMNNGGAFAGAPGNETPNAYLAISAAGGWQTTPLTPPTPQAPANAPTRVSYAFSANLSQTVVRVPLQQLTPEAPAGVYNLYLREAGGAYALLTSIAPPTPPRSGCGHCFEEEDVPAFAGASSDFGHVLFEADDSLVAGAPGGGVENLYEATGAGVRLVGVLPDGSIPPQGASAGGGIEALSEHAHELEHAISEDGSHVLFEADADAGGPDAEQLGETELYDRVDGSATIELSAPAAGARAGECQTKGGVCNPEPAQFWAASANGSVVYFTSRASLTKQSYTGPEPVSGPNPRENLGDDLYRYELSSGTLTDLTPDADEAGDPSGADVLGVVGTSQDGSYVYFVADGRLAAGATSGEANLYLWHQTAEGTGAVTFIATLQAPTGAGGKVEEEELEAQSKADVAYHSDLADWTSRPTESQAYVTPDGRHLAFMSVKPLTGYDNVDPATGEAVHEVFEYSAETGQLACASCDPDGARPLGSAFIGARLDERASTPFHQPRSLNDDGSRLFFSSPDPLVAGISGAGAKLYEYENGSDQLISGSESGGEAVFLDASASGDDVFFATREQLVPSDTDELVDVYDARVDGGSPPPQPASSCQGSACQEPFADAPPFAAPISTTFTGPGNLAAPAPRPAKLTRKQLLARALARCKRIKRRRERAACAAAAARRYRLKAKRRPVHTVEPKAHAIEPKRLRS